MATFTSEQLLVVTIYVQHKSWSFGFVHAKNPYVDVLSLGCQNLCILCDFNILFGSHEQNIAYISSSLSSQEFTTFIDETKLFEVDSSGPQFTWSTRRPSWGFMAAKLDRALVFFFL